MARIVSNYARLILTFVLGIVVVRMMAEIGPDAALIYLLLISSTGIAAMFKFALQNALVPALGLSIDGKGEHDFATVLWTSFVAGCGAGVVSLALFGVFWLLADQLNFGALTDRTIAIALIGTAAQAFASSVGIVFLNVVLVDRRIVTYNILLIVERAVFLASALVVLAFPADTSIDTRLQWFYILTSVLTVLLQLVTYAIAVAGRPALRLRRTALRRDAASWIGALIGWNAVVVVAFALFTRWPPLIVNWSMGETMTLTISIVLTLVGYQRQLSMGLVVGLDAAVARMVGGARADAEAGAKALMMRSTYMLSVFSAFSVVGISLIAEPILVLWFGDTLLETGWTPQLSADLFRIMSFGIAASILSEGWMKYLSGRGEVTAYAPHLILAGVVNMVGVVVAALYFDGETALRIIAFVFSACFLVVNLGFIAVNTARRLGVPLRRFFAVIILPMLAAALAAVPGILLHRGGWTVIEAVGALAFLGLVGLAMLVAMPRVLARLNI